MLARQAVVIVLLGVCAVSLCHVRADDSNQLARSLGFSRQFMFKHHLLAEVTLEPRETSGSKEQFNYDSYPDVERIKMSNGETFARKKGGEWIRSDDWAETGGVVDTRKASELDSRVEIARVAWVAEHTSYDKSQGVDITKLVAHAKAGSDERFVFERTREHPTNPPYPQYTFVQYSNMPKGDLLLERFQGPVVLGTQKLFLTVHYVTLIELKNAQIKVIKRPSPNKQ